MSSHDLTVLTLAIPQKHSKAGAHVTQLPSIIANAQPVSMVAVDMDKETIQMRMAETL